MVRSLIWNQENGSSSLPGQNNEDSILEKGDEKLIDLEIKRGRTPSYRPALETLEAKILPSVTTYSGVQITDLDGVVQTVQDFEWDTASMTYSSALSQSSYAVASESALVSDLSMLSSSRDSNGNFSMMAEESVENMNPQATQVVGGFQMGVTGLAQDSSAFGYTVDTSNVTIDSSVTNISTAQSRVTFLINDARAKLQRNLDILNDINNTSSTIGKVAKALWYDQDLQNNWTIAQREIKELQLIKAHPVYGSIFK